MHPVQIVTFEIKGPQTLLALKKTSLQPTSLLTLISFPYLLPPSISTNALWVFKTCST